MEDWVKGKNIYFWSAQPFKICFEVIVRWLWDLLSSVTPCRLGYQSECELNFSVNRPFAIKKSIVWWMKMIDLISIYRFYRFFLFLNNTEWKDSTSSLLWSSLHFLSIKEWTIASGSCIFPYLSNSNDYWRAI